MTRNINGLSVDTESLETFGAMSKEAFIEFGKPRFFTHESENTQTKWLNELHKIAVESTSKKATTEDKKK